MCSYTIQVDRVKRTVRNGRREEIINSNESIVFADDYNAPVVADVQGFILNGIFAPKEMSFTNDCERIQTVIFKPPRGYNSLKRSEQKQIWWLENHHHALQYSSGDMPIEDITMLLPDHPRIIFVKGEQKEEYFKTIFPNANVINLEKEGMRICLQKTYHKCKNHFRDFSSCARVNVNTIINYLES